MRVVAVEVDVVAATERCCAAFFQDGPASGAGKAEGFEEVQEGEVGEASAADFEGVDVGLPSVVAKDLVTDVLVLFGLLFVGDVGPVFPWAGEFADDGVL